MNAESPQMVTITGGGYTAEIGLRGAQLMRLASLSDELVVPASVGSAAYSGAVLAPWPNRVAGATYSYEGAEYELPVNEEETGAALHGLLSGITFEIQRQTESEVHLAGVLEPTEGYPFRLDILVAYRVSADVGLATTLMARYNPAGEVVIDPDASAPDEESGPAKAPFGAGFHPYLRAGDAPLKECRLRLPARTVVQTQPNGRVIARRPVSGDLDLTNGPLLVGRKIDHPYTDLPEEGWMAELIHGPSGFRVRLISDAGWAQVYTGESIDRAGVAVEPMTCPPNAFNSGEDLVHLAPGEWFRVGYSIEAIRAD